MNDLLTAEMVRDATKDMSRSRRERYLVMALAEGRVDIFSLCMWLDHAPRLMKEAIAWGLASSADLSLGERNMRNKALVKLLSDESQRVFQATVDALGAHISQNGETLLYQALSTFSDPTRLHALRQALAVFAGTGESLKALLFGLRYAQKEEKPLLRIRCWKLFDETPEAFDALASLPVSDEAIEACLEAIPESTLPDWAGTTGEAWLPRLRRLHHLGLLPSEELLGLSITRVMQEGAGKLQVYELLCADSLGVRFLRVEVLRSLGDEHELVVSWLLDWLPYLDNHRKVQATLHWLKRMLSKAEEAFESLLLLQANTSDKQTKGVIRGVIHDWLQLHSELVEEDELFSALRVILSQPIERHTWRLMMMIIERCTTPDKIDLIIDYIDAHLPEDSRKDIDQNDCHVSTLLTDTPSPYLRLLRQLRLEPLFDTLPVGADVLYQLLSQPALANLRQLNCQGVTFDASVGPLMTHTVRLPQLTHLFLSGCFKALDEAAYFLEKLELPKLTHLYLNYCTGPAERLMKLPVLGQLKHLHLKCSMTDALLVEMASYAELASMEKLQLRHSEVTDDGISTLLKSGCLPKQATIDLRNAPLAERSELHQMAMKRGVLLLVD